MSWQFLASGEGCFFNYYYTVHVGVKLAAINIDMCDFQDFNLNK